MVLILQDPLWRLYNLAFLHLTGIARFKVCFCRLVLRDTAATKLCSKFDFSSLVSWRSAHLVSIWQNVSQSIQNTHCKNELELCSVEHIQTPQDLEGKTFLVSKNGELFLFALFSVLQYQSAGPVRTINRWTGKWSREICMIIRNHKWFGLSNSLEI